MRHRTLTSAIATTALLCSLAAPATALEPDRDEPHHLRMLLETTVYLLFGTIWYFSGQDLNSPDWDLEVTGDDLKLKFLGTSQIRFDNNTFLFNQAYHPFAHAGIYLTGRANDMSPYLAFTYTFFASMLWEYIGELREKVSINDMIVSPLTAMAWGEVAHQYAEYFASRESRGHPMRRVLTGFFGIPRIFHDWLDDERPPTFEPPRFHPEPRASVVAGARQYAEGDVQPMTSLELASKMAVMPGFGQVGSDRQQFRDGNFSTFSTELQFTPDQIEIDIDATATIGGLYVRDIKPSPTGGTGVEFMVGGGRGYKLLSREGDQLSDRVGVAHLIGPTTRMRLHGPGHLHIDLGLDAFFDFTAIRSHAVPQLVSAYGADVLEQIRTDTKKHSYYFGVGFTVLPSIAIDVRRYRLELATEITRVHSIQGLDRFQEDVTKVIVLDDLVWESSIALVIPTPARWLDVRLQGHSEHRRSQLDEFSAERSYREAQVGVQSRF